MKAQFRAIAVFAIITSSLIFAKDAGRGRSVDVFILQKPYTQGGRVSLPHDSLLSAVEEGAIEVDFGRSVMVIGRMVGQGIDARSVTFVVASKEQLTKKDLQLVDGDSIWFRKK